MIKIQSNYGQNYQGLQAKQRQSAPSFQGKTNIGERITESLYHKNAIKRMKSLEWLKGEIGGILITAIGTGAVAPIFIGFNPFVRAPKNATPEQKEDTKNTKLYTAMRQPISAVLAILFQASVQKYIDKGLDFVVNNKNIAKYARVNLDQHELNTKSFIKSVVKKDMAKEGLKKPSFISAIFSKDAKQKRKEFDELFDARVKAMQDDQLDKVAKKFQENKGVFKIGERTLDTQSTAKLVNKQIEEYIKDAKDLQKSPEAIAKYLDRAETLTSNKEYLREIFKDIKEENVTTKVQELLGKEKDPKIKVILQEILDRPEDLRMNRINRTLKRINTVEEMCGGTFSREAYSKALLNRNQVLSDRIVELTAARITEPKTATQDAITEAIQKIAKQCSFTDGDEAIIKSVLRDTDTFDNNLERITQKVHKDIAKAYKKLVENNYKSWNQFTKIGVGVLITLPITCTALNWVYPRFMDIFFPKLSGAKKANANTKEEKVGGDK